MSDLAFTETANEVAAPTIALSPEKEAEYQRIVRKCQEVTSGEIVRKVLADGEVVRMYWGA
jgi:tyrosyl-tRNA synthetase